MSEFTPRLDQAPKGPTETPTPEYSIIAPEQKQPGFVQKLISIARSGLVGAVNETAGTKSGVNPFAHDAPKPLEPQTKSDQTPSSIPTPEKL